MCLKQKAWSKHCLNKDFIAQNEKDDFYAGWDAAIAESEHRLWQIQGAKALAHSMQNESRAWMDQRIIQWRNAGDAMMNYVIREWRKEIQE